MVFDLPHINPTAIEVTDHISAMIAYWDKDLICRFSNAAYSKWFNKKREEMVNTITIEELLGPLYEKNKVHIHNALQGQPQTFEREIPLPSGEIRHTLANYYPDVVDNEVVGFYVHVADVTPLKLLEKKLIKSNHTITEQNQRLLNFSNIISHNLKSYADGLASLIEVAQEADDTERERVMGLLSRLSDRFSATICDLNEIVAAQNQAGIKYITINLHDYIEKVKQILQVQIKNTEALIHNNVNKDVTLFVNPAYMESILLNFLSNSLKYQHPDRHPLIEFSSHEDGHNIVLTIKDNGLGIDLTKHGHELFGMYKTFHKNKDAQGIGLFITKYQIESMGGDVEVESEVNQGTTFRVYLNKVSEEAVNA
ncbi:ATP-binding protein [Flavobacterium sp. XGLA_31]|uniref:ATP-binding protein n=1 Tax=Flavobacterium sp. XGLA_31 TaxID=3447666 RepID=UPI003F324546